MSNRRNKRDQHLANIETQQKSSGVEGFGEVQGAVTLTDEAVYEMAAKGEALVQKQLAPKKLRDMMRSDVFSKSVRIITEEFDRLAVRHPRVQDEILRNMLLKQNRVAKEFYRTAPSLYNTITKRFRTKQEELSISAMYQTLKAREKGIYKTEKEADEAYRAAILPFHLQEVTDEVKERLQAEGKQQVEVKQDEELDAVVEQSVSRAKFLKDDRDRMFHDGKKANRVAEVAAENDEDGGQSGGPARRRVPKRLKVDSRMEALERLKKLRDLAEAEAEAGSAVGRREAPPLIPAVGNEISEAPPLPSDPKEAAKVVMEKRLELAEKAMAQGVVPRVEGEEGGGKEELYEARSDLETRARYIEAHGSFPFPKYLPPFPHARDIRATWLRVRAPGQLPSQSVPFPVAPMEDWDEKTQTLVRGHTHAKSIQANLDKAQEILGKKKFQRSRVGPDGAVRASVRTICHN
jgi:hypothetical protein